MNEPDALARETTADGKELVLYRRSGVYTLRVDGLELMSSRSHGSERALARLACRGLQSQNSPRVLVGGLGFGYTLRSALDQLPGGADVIVCEVFGSLFEWNRAFLADLADAPLEDPRVTTLTSDVWDALGPEHYDAVILDVDNGPWALTLQSNQRLYRNDGLTRIASSLNETGRLAVWSSGDAPGFERELRRAGLQVETETVPVRGKRGLTHTLFVGIRGGLEPATCRELQP